MERKGEGSHPGRRHKRGFSENKVIEISLTNEQDLRGCCWKRKYFLAEENVEGKVRVNAIGYK